MSDQPGRLRVAVLCAALLAAAPGWAAEAVTVAVWGSSPAEVAAFEQAAAAFTASTGIEVRKQVIEDKYPDVLKSRFAGGNPPDVFYLDAVEAPLLIESGVLEPLELSAADQADFYPQFLQAFRGRDGRLYGLPKDYSTLALYLNPRLLKQAGYRADDVPRDFNGLMRFAQTLQGRLPRGVAAMIVEKDLARHLAALETSGQPLIGPDGHARFTGNAAAYAYLNQLVAGHAMKYLYSPKDDLGADWPGAAFGTQRTVMMMEGNWVQPSLKHDYGDIPFVSREMPTVNQRKQTMAFVVGYAVPRGARNKAAGLRFAHYMTGPGMRLWASASGTLPTRRSVEAAMQVRTEPALSAHVAGAAYATVWSRGIELPVLNTNFGNQFLAAFNGAKSLQQALEKAETVSNREIERQR
jgi:multiple sugar transport system substrate-binding protein